jgi:hypothetical protein
MVFIFPPRSLILKIIDGVKIGKVTRNGNNRIVGYVKIGLMGYK